VGKEDGTTLGHELFYKNENKVHIMQDLSIPIWNVSSRLKHHGNTNTSWHIPNHKINKPLWIHKETKFYVIETRKRMKKKLIVHKKQLRY
jgi:hypothetical protein